MMTTVLFDIDGTLISTGGAGKIAFAESFRELFGVAEICSNVGFAGRSDRAIALELMELHGIEPTVANWELFTADFLPRLERILPECRGHILPGVIDLLDELAQLSEVSLGLLTGNIAGGARAKLTHYQLLERFHFGGYGDHCTDRSDIAIAALSAAHTFLSQTGVNRGEQSHGKVVVIGDTLADITCARAINAFAVGVATGGATYEELLQAGPDLLVRDLTDSRDLLRHVAAAVAA